MKVDKSGALQAVLMGSMAMMMVYEKVGLTVEVKDVQQAYCMVAMTVSKQVVKTVAMQIDISDEWSVVTTVLKATQMAALRAVMTVAVMALNLVAESVELQV